MLESREAVILEALREMTGGVVLIGGYAVNAYVPPRFSIDCDLVVLDELDRIKGLLIEKGFDEIERGEVPKGEYFRFHRSREKVTFDLLVNSVFDRETGVAFEGALFGKYSKERITVGRLHPVAISMRIADPELLFAMKFVSARRQDIRDVFMLSGIELDWSLIKEMIKAKCGRELMEGRIGLIRSTVMSMSYRDSLQGSYGKIPDKTFNNCIRNLVKFLDGLM